MDQYVIEQNLGLDNFAERFVVRRKNADGILLLSKVEMMDMPMAAVTFDQYRPLLKLSSENVASFFDIFTSIDHRISAPILNLVSEYFPLGNLDRFLTKIRSERELLDRRLIEKWFAEILDGLLYLWSENVVHRNLKPESLFLRGNHRENDSSIVVADFLPDSMAFDLRMRTRLPRRTLSYTAPEVFHNDQFSFQSDIFSFGCVLLDLISTNRLTDEELLQIRICARHDFETISSTLVELENIHEQLSKLIGKMLKIDPSKRLSIDEIRRDDFIIETMRKINSSQMKYPSERGGSSRFRLDLTPNGNFDFYSNFLQTNRNVERQVENAMETFSRSNSIDSMVLAANFPTKILPIVEPFRSNEKIVGATLNLIEKIVQIETIKTSKIVAFLTKLLQEKKIVENEFLIGKIFEILRHFSGNFIETRPMPSLVEIMSKYEDNAMISSEICSLIWLIGKEKIHVDLRKHQKAIFRFFDRVLTKHRKIVDVFIKVCFAFYPFVHQKATFELLLEFNLVRHLTIGLSENVGNLRAVKIVLQILTELFRLDERCILRFLCSRTAEGKLIDAIEVLRDVFKRFDNEKQIASGIVELLETFLPFDDPVDEFISTKINENLLLEIQRFHSDEKNVVEICEKISKRIRRRAERKLYHSE